MVSVAKLSGEDEGRGLAEWIRLRAVAFRSALALKYPQTPHATTISRVLNEAVDMEAFEQVVASHFKAQDPAEAAVALEGKALRGTLEAGQTRGQPLLAAYATQTGVVVGQMTLDPKVNDSVTAPELLKMLPLDGRVVTGDAMGAQQALSQQIGQAHGDYQRQPTVATLCY